MTAPTHPGGLRDRLRSVVNDDHGAGFSIPALVMLLALTALACLSLLIDGGRATTAQRNANTIAFQAARAGAQHLDETQLRDGTITISPAADSAARATADTLLAEVGLTGSVTAVTINGQQLTVTVVATADLTTAAVFGRPTVTVTGTGTTRIAAGVTTEEAPLP